MQWLFLKWDFCHFCLLCFLVCFLSPSVCVGWRVRGFLQLVKVMLVKATGDSAISSSDQQLSHGQSCSSTSLPSSPPAFSPLRLLQHLRPHARRPLKPSVLPERPNLHVLRPSLPPISRLFMLELSCSLSISPLRLFNNSNCVPPAVQCVR